MYLYVFVYIHHIICIHYITSSSSSAVKTFGKFYKKIKYGSFQKCYCSCQTTQAFIQKAGSFAECTGLFFRVCRALSRKHRALFNTLGVFERAALFSECTGLLSGNRSLLEIHSALRIHRDFPEYIGFFSEYTGLLFEYVGLFSEIGIFSRPFLFMQDDHFAYICCWCWCVYV